MQNFEGFFNSKCTECSLSQYVATEIGSILWCMTFTRFFQSDPTWMFSNRGRIRIHFYFPADYRETHAYTGYHTASTNITTLLEVTKKKRSTRKGENILWKVTLNSYFPLQAKGKIIVFDQQFVSYEVTVVYRDFGAYEASKVGGVASLIRSITPFSIDSPHTGWQYYKNGTAKIPTACITVEDAEMLSRMAARGDKIVLHLYMEAQNFSPAISRNTVAEIVGTTNPEQVGMYIPYWKNDKVEFKPTRILHVSYLIHIPTVLCKISRNQRDYICSAF